MVGARRYHYFQDPRRPDREKVRLLRYTHIHIDPIRSSSDAKSAPSAPTYRLSPNDPTGRGHRTSARRYCKRNFLVNNSSWPVTSCRSVCSSRPEAIGYDDVDDYIVTHLKRNLLYQLCILPIPLRRCFHHFPSHLYPYLYLIVPAVVSYTRFTTPMFSHEQQPFGATSA